MNAPADAKAKWNTCPRCGSQRGHHRCVICQADDDAARAAQGLKVVNSSPVACPFCGAKVDEACTTPSGGRLPLGSHRARIVLSIVGDKHEAAVRRVQKILEDNTKRQAAAAAKEG